jgi:hypothetical protein
LINEPLPSAKPEEVVPEELEVETSVEIPDNDIDYVQPNEDGQITLF